MCDNPKTPYLLLLLDSGLHMLMRADCKTYGCEHCGKVRQQTHFVRIYQGALELATQHPLAFVTLTCHPALKTYEATKAIFPLAWKKLQQRWRREQNGLEYAMCFEMHQSGRLHAHLIVWCEVNKRWLKDNAAQCGLGYQVSLDRLTDDNLKRRVGYVAKYATKKANGMKGRNVNYSRGYPKLAELPKDHIVEIWRYNHFDSAMAVIARLGIEEVLLRTGEFVDAATLTQTMVIYA